MAHSGSGSDDDTYVPPPATDVGSTSRRRKTSTRLGRRQQSARVVVPGARYVPRPGTDGASTSAQEPVIPEGTEGLAPIHVDANGIRTYHIDQEVVRYTPDGRIILETVGDSFLPSKKSATAVITSIRENLHKGWKNWTAVRKDRDAIAAILGSFLEKCTWLPEEQQEVERVFHKRCSHRYSELLGKARLHDEKPPCMGDSSWYELKKYWATPGFKLYCEKAKKNRASDKGRCTHTGGSVNAATHHRRLEAMHQRPVTLPELYCYLHVREDTGDFVTDHAREIQENFEAGISEYRDTQEHSSENTEVDPVEEARAAREIWERAVGPRKSNRLVGSGGIGPSAFRTSVIPSLSSSGSVGSTARSYVPSTGDLNAVTELTQQLSQAHRDFAERQEQSAKEMQELQERTRLAEARMEEQAKLAAEQSQLAAEQARLNEERYNHLMSQLSQQQYSRPSSSHMPSYPPPQQHFSGAFQPWSQYPQQYPPQQQQYPPQPQQQQYPPRQQQPYQLYPPQQVQPSQQQFNSSIDLNNIDHISAYLASDDATGGSYYNHNDDSDQPPPQ